MNYFLTGNQHEAMRIGLHYRINSMDVLSSARACSFRKLS
jgi:hypothetical protein